MSKLNDAALLVPQKAKALGRDPDNQMAYFILEQSTSLLTDEWTTLPHPAAWLFVQREGSSIPTVVLGAVTTEAILDFTSIRQLYDGADPKTVAVLCIGRKPRDNHRILHLTFRRTFSVKERIAFELDHYDRHFVIQGSNEKRPWIWRANLLGGGRLQNLAARMDELPKLRDFLRKMGLGLRRGFRSRQNRQPSTCPMADRQAIPTHERFRRERDRCI